MSMGHRSRSGGLGAQHPRTAPPRPATRPRIRGVRPAKTQTRNSGPRIRAAVLLGLLLAGATRCSIVTMPRSVTGLTPDGPRRIGAACQQQHITISA
ncbi:hypothetical protein LG3211_3216 [Lysobacter gummosus]|nr:hypothetical protein LG3211_3216 [Lysobacter gummosus]